MADKTFNIKFVSIDMISKSISEPPPPEKITSTFHFNFLIDIKLSPELKSAFVLTEVSVLLEKDFTDKVAFFKTGCIFEFLEFENIFTKIEENKYNIPVEIEIVLKSAGLSTTRGMIYSEVKGTYLHNAVLPLIDIGSLINKNRSENK